MSLNRARGRGKGRRNPGSERKRGHDRVNGAARQTAQADEERARRRAMILPSDEEDSPSDFSGESDGEEAANDRSGASGGADDGGDSDSSAASFSQLGTSQGRSRGSRGGDASRSPTMARDTAGLMAAGGAGGDSSDSSGWSSSDDGAELRDAAARPPRDDDSDDSLSDSDSDSNSDSGGGVGAGKPVLEPSFEEQEARMRRGFTNERSELGRRLAAARRNRSGSDASSGRDRRKPRPKRVNKNAPAEMSSRRPVGRHREVVQVKKRVIRDPRFEESSGRFNEDAFRKSYGFIDEYRSSEISSLKKTLKKTKDDGKRTQLQAQLTRLQQQRAQESRSARIREVRLKHKRKEREAVKAGKQPYHLKAREWRELELRERFKELEGKGKIDKFLAKKRKSNASKDHRWMPRERRSAKRAREGEP